ncbi:MAG TPA: hypothetical protein VF234_09735 [Limnochordia bacterium]
MTSEAASERNADPSGGSVIAFFSPCRDREGPRLLWRLTERWAARGLRVALADGDLNLGGSLADLAGCPPDPNAGDAILGGRAVSALQVSAVTIPVRAGVRLLAAPTRPDRALALEGAPFGRLLRRLRCGFDLIAVDLPPRLDATTVAACCEADRVVILAGRDEPDRARLARALALLEVAGLGRDSLSWLALEPAQGDSAWSELFGKPPLGEVDGGAPTTAGGRLDDIADQLVARAAEGAPMHAGDEDYDTARATLPAFRHFVHT